MISDRKYGLEHTTEIYTENRTTVQSVLSDKQFYYIIQIHSKSKHTCLLFQVRRYS